MMHGTINIKSDFHFRSKNKMTQHFRGFLQCVCRYSSIIHIPCIAIFRRRLHGNDSLVFRNFNCADNWTSEHVKTSDYFYYLRQEIQFELRITLLLKYRMTQKNGNFKKPNKNWRNPRKKIYWQKLNHYNLSFKRQ